MLTVRNKEQHMAYKIIASKAEMDEMRVKYGPRKGLEGPFNFSGRVLYYDVKQGEYYDPSSDFYLEQSEMDMINNRLVDILRK
jgi:hypothetical protein